MFQRVDVTMQRLKTSRQKPRSSQLVKARELMDTLLWPIDCRTLKMSIRSVSLRQFRSGFLDFLIMKFTFQEIFFTVLPDEENVITMIFKSLSLSVRPALEAASDYGNCTEKRKQDFLYGVDQFLNFLKSKLKSLKSFFVDFDYLMFKARRMTSSPATFTSRYLTSSSKAFFCLHTKLKVIQYRKSFLCY